MPRQKIKVSSGKAKGRKLQQWTAKMISQITGRPYGKDEEIESREMGQSGVDVKLYAKAKEMFPFSIECKYQETWSVPAWIKQAKENKLKGTDWLLLIRKNRHEEIVVMDAKAFFDIYEELIMFTWGEK
jgi:hypothetical protein